MTYSRMIFPINADKEESDINKTYSTRTSESDAFDSVSVNPLLKTVNIDSENSNAVSRSYVNSMIFTEIRNTAYGGLISSDTVPSTRIVNRLLPYNDKTLTTHASNQENTPSYKVKIYDSLNTVSATNRLATAK